jgi:hypothetical protein
MQNLPLENQVCTREQARKLNEIFKKAGIEPPGSLWVWRPRYIGESICEYILQLRETVNIQDNNQIINNCIAAYTGDELGVILKRNRILIISLLVQDRAEDAIEALEEGWIKPEDFKYE